MARTDLRREDPERDVKRRDLNEAVRLIRDGRSACEQYTSFAPRSSLASVWASRSPWGPRCHRRPAWSRLPAPSRTRSSGPRPTLTAATAGTRGMEPIPKIRRKAASRTTSVRESS